MSCREIEPPAVFIHNRAHHFDSDKITPDPVMTRLGEVFGHMLATIDRSAPIKERRFFAIRAREPQAFYGFIASNAIEWLMKQENSDKEEATRKLQSFINARLLHFPDDRMCASLKSESVELQPTAKGFAYLEEWCRGNVSQLSFAQRENVTTALSSPFNSMQLVRLERRLIGETLQYSTGLAIWLWMRMLGSEPNVFDGTTRKEDKLTERKRAVSVFNVNIVDVTELSLSEELSQNVKTPYWNTAMVHPSSSSLMQYWDSRGMRLFKSLEFERPLKSKFDSCEKYAASLCFSGKAMWQWIMECTTAEKPSEAAKIVRLFLDQRFIHRISDRLLSCATCEDDLPAHVSRETFYRFTQRGLRLCAWEDTIDVDLVKPSNSDHDEENVIKWMMSGGPDASEIADARTWAWMFTEKPMRGSMDDNFRQLVTLDIINREPGLKIPFREKLGEWHCEENLRYVEDAQRLLLLLKASREVEGTVTRHQRLQSEMQQEVLRLRNFYVTPGSPFQLNLSQALRDGFLAAILEEDDKIEVDVNRIETSIAEIQAECMTLLNDQVTRFIQEDILRSLPLCSYVVGSYKHLGTANI